MRMSLPILAFLLLTIPTWAADDKPPQAEADTQSASEISRTISRLNDERAVERDAAEKKLLELAGTSTAEVDRFLQVLHQEEEKMPVKVRERLAQIRRQVEERATKAVTAATKITLSAKAMPLAEVVAAIEKQTGNRLIDNREQQNGQATAKAATIDIDLKDERFWPAVDQIADQAKSGINCDEEKNALSIVTRRALESPRRGRAAYNGPFRLDITDVQAARNLRHPNRTSLNLQLEVAWEPRLRPIAISQPAADLQADLEDGGKLAVALPKAILTAEVPNGTQAAEITLPFELPSRSAKRITALHGKLRALVATRQVKFRFDDLANAGGKKQRIGGVQVTVDNVRKNNAVWEVHMWFSLDEGNNSLEAHRNWVFQNLSYMLDKDGNQIENGGLETTRQTKNEVGVAYVFDVPSIDGLSWVYETPAAIVDLPVEYEIKDIELP